MGRGNKHLLPIRPPLNVGILVPPAQEAGMSHAGGQCRHSRKLYELFYRTLLVYNHRLQVNWGIPKPTWGPKSAKFKRPMNPPGYPEWSGPGFLSSQSSRTRKRAHKLSFAINSYGNISQLL
ncbi:hypothetical protein L0F63_007421 [Massospora cicadina]|nr:hypothetical protein L0F63_007421 [Massospora cicadina]